MGAHIGACVDSDHVVPVFVMDAPRSFKRAFLMGLFGGDGDSPTSQVSGKTYYVCPAIGYSFSKVNTRQEAGKRCLNQVVQLLAEFGWLAKYFDAEAGGAKYAGELEVIAQVGGVEVGDENLGLRLPGGQHFQLFHCGEEAIEA